MTKSFPFLYPALCLLLYYLYYFILVILVAVFVINLVEFAHASQRNYNNAEDFARSLHDQLGNMATQGDPSTVPQFKGDNPPKPNSKIKY